MGNLFAKRKVRREVVLQSRMRMCLKGEMMGVQRIDNHLLDSPLSTIVLHDRTTVDPPPGRSRIPYGTRLWHFG